MTCLISLFAPVVGEKFAKAAAFGSIAILILLALWGGKCAYDHGVISNYQNKVDASAAKADRKADDKAAQQKFNDVERQNEEADQLIKVQANAKNATERNLAFHRCLRLQQRARDNGLVTPKCV